MLEQQTVFMNLKDISPFQETNIDAPDNPDEEIIKTNFDHLIEDITDDIIDTGGTAIQKSFFVANEKIYCIISWINQNALQKKFPNIAIPDFENKKF